jgi:hypothetical protein
MAKKLDALSIPEPNSGCWLWLGTMTNSGYGMIGSGGNRKNGGKPMGAHQAAWVVSRGAIPGGMQVCHHCDVKVCINPDHLYLGTPKKNMEDAAARGRLRRGMERRNAKFSDDDIRDIRKRHASGETYCAIGRAFGVGHTHVRKIVTGEIWAHVP